MTDDAHDLSKIEQLEQRLQVTTKFAARLAADLVAKTRLGLSSPLTKSAPDASGLV